MNDFAGAKLNSGMTTRVMMRVTMRDDGGDSGYFNFAGAKLKFRNDDEG